MEDKNKRLLRYLNDSYAAEVGGLMALKDLAILAAQEPALKSAVEEHIRVTQTQADRLRNRILALGGDKSEPKAFVNSTIAKGSSFVNMFHDKEDKLTQDLIKAYSFEHFEIGTYTALSTYAESIGDVETARLAVQIMDEERMAAEQLERFIPACARKAIYKTAEYNHSDHRPDSGRAILGVPANMVLIPGALLAVWGFSKWLEGYNERSRNNGYRPMTPTTYDYDSGAYARRDIPATGTAVITSEVTTNTTAYGSGSTYGAASTTGADLGGGTAVGTGSTSTLGSTYGATVSEPSGEDSGGMGASGGGSRVTVVE